MATLHGLDVENPPPSPPPLPPHPHHHHPPPHPPRSLRREIPKILYEAAICGDWKTGERTLRDNQNYVRDRITTRRDTVLHIAALGGNKLFVSELVKMLSSSDLEAINDYGCTAFHNAVISGVVENAVVMIEKNERLSIIRPYSDITPIHQAALMGLKEMVSYLYTVTPLEELKRPERIKLLEITIYKDMYDVALKILKEDRPLALAPLKGNRSILHMLVRKQRITLTGEKQGIGRRFPSSTRAVFSTLFSCKGIEEESFARREARELLGTIWEEYHKMGDDMFREVITRQEILHYAAKEGNIEFLDMILQSKPDLFWESNKSGQSILHVAVLYRQKNVVNYICNKHVYKDIMTLLLDENNNNILHLAAMDEKRFAKYQDDDLWFDEEEGKVLVPEKKKEEEVKIVPESALQLSTAALQFEREISWFKEVEHILPCSLHDMRNKKGKTPKQLFLEEHKELMRNAEKSIRAAAKSCMLVATLIATVAFSAAFTIPGGNDENTGIPIFRKQGGFTAFTISDAIAMMYSMVSILIFLSIFIWRDIEDNLDVALQRLFVGLAGLIVSICGMLAAFTTAFILVYNSEWQPILIAALAGMPIGFASILFLNTKMWFGAVWSIMFGFTKR